MLSQKSIMPVFETSGIKEPVDLANVEEHDSCKPHEECGVFGVYTPEEGCAARMAFFALFSLQHRGQEAAGIVSADGHQFHKHKGLGLVTHVFSEESIQHLSGHLAVGHTRYSTTGAPELRNAQPFVVQTHYGEIAVAHNGELVHASRLRNTLLERGVGLFSTSDSEIITQMLAAVVMGPDGKPVATSWEDRIGNFVRLAEGAYSLVILTRDALFGVRDLHGLRPLCIGRMESVGDSKYGYCLASESCALGTVGAELLREVLPGEIVRIDQHGMKSTMALPVAQLPKQALCIFEYIYFARPDSILQSQLVHEVRQRLGKQLAIECPCPEGDLVMAVPDSGTPAAIGFSLQSGIPFGEGLTKNRYIGRTFIEPNQRLREKGIMMKFNPLMQNIRGKNIVVIDDSIVRGSTLGKINAMLRKAGAKSIHIRITCPPVRYPCFMGIDMSTFEELVANQKSVEQIRAHIGADSLGYLSLEGMTSAVVGSTASSSSSNNSSDSSDSSNSSGSGSGTGSADKNNSTTAASAATTGGCASGTGGCGSGVAEGHCTACFSGVYPIDIEDVYGKARSRNAASPLAAFTG